VLPGAAGVLACNHDHDHNHRRSQSQTDQGFPIRACPPPFLARARANLELTRQTFARVIMSDAALAQIAAEVGLVENGELVPANELSGEEDEGEVKDDKTSLKAIASHVLHMIQEKKNVFSVEVADVVVDDALKSRPPRHLSAEEQKDESRVLRRKVYDVINVLAALGIVTKQKKRLKWYGVPFGSPADIEMQAYERDELLSRVRELLVHQLALHNLHARRAGQPEIPEDERVSLPFMAVTTVASGNVQCEISEDRSQLCLTFAAPFDLMDDNEILKLLKYHDVSADLAKAVVRVCSGGGCVWRLTRRALRSLPNSTRICPTTLPKPWRPLWSRPRRPPKRQQRPRRMARWSNNCVCAGACAVNLLRLPRPPPPGPLARPSCLPLLLSSIDVKPGERVQGGPTGAK
jgi:hypothetical protein